MLLGFILKVQPHPDLSEEMDQSVDRNSLHHVKNLKITLIKRGI
jgi:hypothetical protein